MHSSESLTNNPKINFDKYENENILRIIKVSFLEVLVILLLNLSSLKLIITKKKIRI